MTIQLKDVMSALESQGFKSIIPTDAKYAFAMQRVSVKDTHENHRFALLDDNNKLVDFASRQQSNVISTLPYNDLIEIIG